MNLSRSENPTDDEREALADLVLGATEPFKVTNAWLAADAILAAGFRRSEVHGEPSDAQVEAALQAWMANDEEYGDIAMRAALRAARGVR